MVYSVGVELADHEKLCTRDDDYYHVPHNVVVWFLPIFCLRTQPHHFLWWFICLYVSICQVPEGFMAFVRSEHTIDEFVLFVVIF